MSPKKQPVEVKQIDPTPTWVAILALLIWAGLAVALLLAGAP